MLVRRLLLGTLLLLVGLPWASTADAQRGIHLERFVPAFDQEGFIGVQGTKTPGPMRYNVSLVASFATDPLVVGPPETSVIRSRLGMDLMLQLGLGTHWAVGLDIPFVPYQDTNGGVLPDGKGPVASGGVGDPRLVLRHRIVGEGASDTGARTDGPGLAFQLGATLPVGDPESFIGESGTTTDVNVLGDFHIFGAGIGASLGWRHRFRPKTILDVRVRDEVNFGVGIAVPIPVVTGLSALLEIRGITDAGRPFFDAATTAVEGSLGLRLAAGDFTFMAAAGPGFSSGLGVPGARFLGAIDWAPRVRDADHDGILDSKDKCPYLPEDFDGFEDDDGCLDPDNDNDMVPDEDDKCPNQAADENRDEDEDGCTDPFKDRDHDGIEDANDACPSRPEDFDGFEDDDGCAEDNVSTSADAPAPGVSNPKQEVPSATGSAGNAP